MRLSPEEYIVAQRAYDAWALFGIAIFGALISTLWHAYVMRGNGAAVLLSLASFLLLCGTQIVFWIYTYPTNVATRNWTSMPDQFEAVRRQWEYSHAVSAVLAFAALITHAARARCSPLSDGPFAAGHGLYVVATHSGSSCARRSNERKS